MNMYISFSFFFYAKDFKAKSAPDLAERLINIIRT